MSKSFNNKSGSGSASAPGISSLSKTNPRIRATINNSGNGGQASIVGGQPKPSKGNAHRESRCIKLSVET
jgi:hypothetical protein